MNEHQELVDHDIIIKIITSSGKRGWCDLIEYIFTNEQYQNDTMKDEFVKVISWAIKENYVDVVKKIHEIFGGIPQKLLLHDIIIYDRVEYLCFVDNESTFKILNDRGEPAIFNKIKIFGISRK